MALLAALAAVCLTLIGGASLSTSSAEDASYTIWSDDVTPDVTADVDSLPVTVGTLFYAKSKGTISSVRFYRSKENQGPYDVQLWKTDGSLLATGSSSTTETGWVEVPLDKPVQIAAWTRYTVSYTAPRGRYADDTYALAPADQTVNKDLVALQGVYSYDTDAFPTDVWKNSNYYVDFRFTPAGGTVPSPSASPTSGATASPTDTPTASPTATATPTKTPTPTPTPSKTATSTPTPTPTPSQTAAPSNGSFPDASNTGVPSGVSLTTYTGSTTITKDGTVIDGKRINGDVMIKADNVTITDSEINGRLSSDYGGSVTVEDSTIDGGNQETFPSVSYENITLKRVEVTGGQHSVQCSAYCTIVDSWLHDQYLPASSDGHVNAFISNGGHDLVLRHNTVHCTVTLTANDGGCSGDVSLFGDFDPISDVTIDNNLFKANQVSISYCLYAGYNPGKPYGSNPTRVSVTNNVFERGLNGKCGVYGPVTSFLKANGNVWSGNVWQGTTIAIPAAE